MVQVRHGLAWRLGGYPAGRRGDGGRVRDGAVLRRLHHEPAARRPAGRPGLGGVPVRRPGPGARARRPGPPARAAPVLLEVGQVGERDRPHGARPAGLLGVAGLSQLRRPMARAAVLGRLNWLTATVSAVRDETATARTIVLDVPGWPGHAAGQHVDVRLTAPDGYSAQRSYSIASAPAGSRLELTVQRLEDGEVSPYLAQILEVGYPLELRGPIGGWFVWDAAGLRPVLLVAGGSGIVPLMAMIRTRAA